jgi:hypothetical protein
VALEPAALPEIRAIARRVRHRRALGLASGVLTLVVAFVAGAQVDRTGGDSLRQVAPADRPTETPSHRPASAPGAGAGRSTDASAGPVQGATSGVDVAGSASNAGAGPGPGAAPSASVSGPPHSGVSAPRTVDPVAAQVPYSDARYRPEACTPMTSGGDSTVKPARYREWCVAGTPYTDPTQSQSYLSLSVCHAAVNQGVGGPEQLEFATTQRVDFEVRGPSGDILWTYDPPFEAARGQLQVAHGTCAQWLVEWDSTDESGRPLPGGDYDLRSWTTATSVSEAVDRTPFTL